MKYVVEIMQVGSGYQDEVATNLAGLINISFDKAHALISRAPGVVTKPLNKDEADTIAHLFSQAGLEANTRLENPEVVNTLAFQPPKKDKVEGVQDLGFSEPAHEGSSPGIETSDYADTFTPIEHKAASEHESPERHEDVAHVSQGEDVTHVSASNVEETQEIRPQEVTAMTSQYVGDSQVRFRLRTKFLLIGLLGLLLVIGTVVLANNRIVQPALRQQAELSAMTVATSLAASVAGLSDAEALTDSEVRIALQEVMDLSQASLSEQDVHMVVITDIRGRPIVGWPRKDQALDITPSVLAKVEQQGLSSALGNPLTGSSQSTAGLEDAGLSLSAVAIQNDGVPIGSVVVGMSEQGIAERIQGSLFMSLALGLIPFILSLLGIAFLVTFMTGQIKHLSHAIRQMIHDAPFETVTVKSNDELGSLGQDIETLRQKLEARI